MYQIKNTFGIPASASHFIEYSGADDLAVALKCAGRPFLHIGSASNLLFTKDFEGTVFHCNNKNVEVLSETKSDVLVKVGAGYLWDSFVALCVEKGWYGAENLSLIPGEVGAAAVQNIGAYGAEAKDIIDAVNTYDTENNILRTFPAHECRYSYRHSIFKEADYKRYFVLSVQFRLSRIPSFRLDYGNLHSFVKEQSLGAVRNAVIEIRRSKLPDPEQIGSAGSFFMNPLVPFEVYERLAAEYPDMPHYPAPDGQVKLAAGWLIEQCGWKGKKLGNAAVYQKQSLIIVNAGGATGRDILNLAEQVISSVEEKFGISLKMEVQVV